LKPVSKLRRRSLLAGPAAAAVELRRLLRPGWLVNGVSEANGIEPSAGPDYSRLGGEGGL
jgi:hypothetical protein